MSAVVVGAGSVGLTLAARLAGAGLAVRLATRRPEAARALAEGLVVEDPETGATRRLAVPAGSDLARALEGASGPLFVCVRGPDVPSLADALAALRPGAWVVSFLNDVVHEDTFASRGLRPIGGVWRETCTRVGDARVRFRGAGRAVVGLHPQGTAPEARRSAELLRAAGIDAGLSSYIVADKWLKLCVNLMSAPNALVKRSEHASWSFVRVKIRLLEEARDVLAAARIPTASGDGRDRSLDEEIAFQREAWARGRSARPIPLYNQVWVALKRGTPPEADAYHRRLLCIAEKAGVEAPVNARVLARLLRAWQRREGPECASTAELLPAC